MDALSEIARAVLYEGYLLWPYRRSALKNQRRWTFGCVLPRAFSESGHPDDPWAMCTEVLLEGDVGMRVEGSVRFLHVVERRLAEVAEEEALRFVDELSVGGERHLAWDEATERVVNLPGVVVGVARDGRDGGEGVRADCATVPVDVPAGQDVEWLTEGGRRVGAVVRSWRALQGAARVAVERRAERLWRVRVEIENTGAMPPGSDREDALRHAFVSTHTVLRAAGTCGSERSGWVSLTDPPDALREEAGACRNIGTWPVLAGEDGERHTLLSSPIILPDHPRVAPESPGDLFDGAEIDQLLILTTLSLSDGEQEEMRATDPKAREILERSAGLSDAERLRLYGAVRERRPVTGEPG